MTCPASRSPRGCTGSARDGDRCSCSPPLMKSRDESSSEGSAVFQKSARTGSRSERICNHFAINARQPGWVTTLATAGPCHALTSALMDTPSIIRPHLPASKATMSSRQREETKPIRMCLSASAIRLSYENCALRSLHVPFTQESENSGDMWSSLQHGRRALAMAGSQRGDITSDGLGGGASPCASSRPPSAYQPLRAVRARALAFRGRDRAAR